jgi:hypothetical protein
MYPVGTTDFMFFYKSLNLCNIFYKKYYDSIMLTVFPKVNEFIVKKDEDGTTSDSKKTPLILQGFFLWKFGDNEVSMA